MFQPAAEEKIPKVDVEPKVAVVEEVESSPAVEKEEPPPATPVPPLTLVQVKLANWQIGLKARALRFFACAL